MKLEPVAGWVIATVCITKMPGKIISPDVAKRVTRCYLIEESSPEAQAAGYNRGDLVVSKSVFDMFFKGGSYHRVTFPMDEIISRVRGVPLSDFVDTSGNDVQPLEGAA